MEKKRKKAKNKKKLNNRNKYFFTVTFYVGKFLYLFS